MRHMMLPHTGILRVPGLGSSDQGSAERVRPVPEVQAVQTVTAGWGYVQHTSLFQYTSILN